MPEPSNTLSTDLGKTLGEFRPNRGLFFLLIILGIPMLACGAFTAVSELFKPDTQLAGVIVGAALFALGASASWFSYRRLTKDIRRYIAYEKGLVEVRKRDRIAIRWDEIILIWRDAAQIREPGQSSSDSERIYTWRLQGRDGQDWRVIGQHKLGRLIEEHTYPLIWEQLRAGVEAGKTVRFGEIAISQAGIGYGEEQIPWEAIDSLSFASHVRIKTETGQRDLRWAKTANLPNLPLLKKAIEEFGGIAVD